MAPEDVAARLNDGAVIVRALDDGIRLRLYDLDRARYDLRMARLRELLLVRVFGSAASAEDLSVAEYVRRQASAAATSEPAFVAAAFERAGIVIELTPPEPPVVEVSADDDPGRGPADAPVTVVVFCDFQSPYCRRMQPLFLRLLADYPRQVRLVWRDFPQPGHRDAVRAAEAAECAGDQGAYWPYHDVLLQEQADLGRPALERYAARTGLAIPRFRTCLDERRMRTEVEADAAEARRLGLATVPTTFVDGRYLRGPQTYEGLRAAVTSALARRGLSVPAPTPSAAGASSAPPTSLPPDGAAAPASIITLPAVDVQRALERRQRLARDLERPAYDLGPGYENRSIVRVRRVRPGSLYEAMGLHPGDVVVRVNDAVVLDGGDALFDAFRQHSTLTVQILRKGQPLTFEYRVER